MKNKKKIIIISATVIALMAVVVFAYYKGRNGGGEEKIETIEKQVRVQDIKLQDSVIAPLAASGVVEPKQHSTVKSLTPGTLGYIIPVGSKVIVGQPLFNIMDSNIENNFFNAAETLQQTEIITNQRIRQAELALTGAEARLNLAELSVDNTIAQNNQSMRLATDSAAVAYNSAHNTLSQTINFLTVGVIEDYKYIYKDIDTTHSQLKRDTESLLPEVADGFVGLNYPVNENNLIDELNKMHTSLVKMKNFTDSTSVVLQNAIAGSAFSEAEISGDRTILSGYQTQINGHITNIISSINNIRNTEIGGELALDRAQSQLSLSEIDYNNAEIALNNAKESGDLEKNSAMSRLDSAAYSYGNLSIPAPFSGTVISHLAKEGDQVSPGQPIIEIGDLSISEIKVNINVSFSEAVHLGDEVLIENKYRGLISEIEPIGDLASGKVGISIESADQSLSLMSGSLAEVKFSLTYRGGQMIVVPIKSVNVESRGNYVFVFEDGLAVRRNVNLGKVFGDKVQIESGLSQGDKMILQNGVFISEGDKVTVSEQN